MNTMPEAHDDPRDVAPYEPGQLSPRSADEFKASTVAARQEAVRAQMELETQIAAIEDERKALEAKLNAQRSALMERLKPMRAEVARLKEVSWTIDLYSGRDEDVTLLVDGSPAPADTPITVRQNVLYADEESLVLAQENTFDHSKMSSFLDWLKASPENRARIVPDQRCVVVVKPTRQIRRYGNAWEQQARDAENSRAYWLIRNGERLYLLVTDPDLEVGDRLTPARDEFVKHFYERSFSGETGKPLTPGTDQWIKAETKADKAQRHYMRLMLVLQGLVDRTVVFHPLPEGGVNLMSLGAQDAGQVRIFDENAMALTDGRMSFREWQKALNRQLRPGMRVVVSRGIDQHNFNYGEVARDYRQRNSRIWPDTAELPPIGEPLMIAEAKDGHFIARYRRTLPVWRDFEEVYLQRPASVKLHPDDDFVLPFDLATVEDLEYYRDLRSERRSYPDTVRVILSALEAKAAEREAEAPLRAAIASTLGAEAAGEEDLDEQISELAMWWRWGARHAGSLTESPEVEAAASTAIVAEWRKRFAQRPTPEAAATIIAAGQALPDVLMVAQTGAKKFVAYTVADADHGPWVHEYTITTKGAAKLSREWIRIAPATLRSQRPMWTSSLGEGWDWSFDVKAHLTGPERAEMIQRALAWATDQGLTPIVVTEARRDGYSSARGFTVYAWAKDADPTDHDVWDAGGREHRGNSMDAFTVTAKLLWQRDGDGTVEPAIDASRHSSWEIYSSDFDDPGEPCSGGQFHDDSRSSKVWGGDEYERALRLSLSHYEMSQAKRERHFSEVWKTRRRAQEWCEALAEAWLSREAESERQRFIEDFGTSDEALWEHHRKTLKLASRVPRQPRWLDQAAEVATRAVGDLWGKSVDDVIELYRANTTDPEQIDDNSVRTWRGLVPTKPEEDQE